MTLSFETLYLIQFITSSLLGMEIQSSQKQSENDFQDFEIAIELPFIIKPSHFRKSHRYERDGHWNQKQRLKYAVFLTFFRTILEDQVKKKKVKIYEMMSDMIITRNSNQCRSHHQKMEKYRQTIPEIISSVAEKYEPTLYKEQTQKYMVLIKILLENVQKYRRGGDRLYPERNHLKENLVSENVLEDERPGAEKRPQVEVEPSKQLDQYPNDYPKPPEIEGAEKKQLKKTVDDYSQDDEKNRSQDEEDVPVMRLDDLKEQDEHDLEYMIGDQIEMKEIQQEPQPQPQPQPPTFPTPNYLLNSQNRYYYEQQIMSLELKKQWHSQNADQLYTQLNTEIQSIKYCDQTIKLYQQVLLASNNHPN